MGRKWLKFIIYMLRKFVLISFKVTFYITIITLFIKAGDWCHWFIIKIQELINVYIMNKPVEAVHQTNEVLISNDNFVVEKDNSIGGLLLIFVGITILAIILGVGE